MEQNDIIKKYEYSAAKQTDSCSKKSDRMVYMIFLSAWGFLFTSPVKTDKFILSATVAFAIFYFACKVFRLYWFAKFARDTLNKYAEGKISDKEEMYLQYNKESNWTFSVLKVQLVFLILMTISLCLYVIRILFI